MLGLAPNIPPVAGAEPDAGLAALARSLQNEAARRGRAQKKPGARIRPKKWGRAAVWINASISMAAAALVVVSIATATLVAWSSRLGRREEALAAKTAELDARQSRLEEAMKAAGAKEGKEGKESDAARPMLQAAKPVKPDDKKGRNDGKGEKGELVKPEETPARLDNVNERRLVKDSR
jgi:hypothetical protein